MSKKWLVLTAVACGTFMATLDSGIVNLALPILTTEVFSTEMLVSKWVIVAYYFIITILLLPFGRLSDRYGRKRMFFIGFLVFTLGSAFCGLSQSILMLVLSRLIQGTGAAMLMANGPAVITAAFPDNERGKALGTLAMVVSVGLISGPSIGGLLIQTFGWRSIFLINIPFGILGIVLVFFYIKKDKKIKIDTNFDWVGAILQSIVFTLVIVLFDPPRLHITGTEDSFSISRWLVAIALFIMTLVLIEVEAKVESPLLDLQLIRIRTFWTANLASFLMFVAYSTIFILIPFFLTDVMKMSPKTAGLYLTSIPVMMFIVSPISGRLSDRFGSQELSVAGAAVCTVSLFAMSGLFGSGLSEESESLSIILALCMIGLALGLFQSPNNNAIMGAVPKDKLGAASAHIATARNLGLFVGAGFATAIFSWKESETGDFETALHFSHFVAGFVGLMAILASLGKPKGPVWKASNQ